MIVNNKNGTNELKGEPQQEEDYIAASVGTIRKIIESVARDKNAPTQLEMEIVKILAEKMLPPYFYWKNESYSDNPLKRSGHDSNEYLNEIARKYDLDITEIDGNPSRIKPKRFFGREFGEVASLLENAGYTYEKESRSFVRKGKGIV